MRMRDAMGEVYTVVSQHWRHQGTAHRAWVEDTMLSGIYILVVQVLEREDPRRALCVWFDPASRGRSASVQALGVSGVGVFR